MMSSHTALLLAEERIAQRLRDADGGVPHSLQLPYGETLRARRTRNGIGPNRPRFSLYAYRRSARFTSTASGPTNPGRMRSSWSTK